jgi:hypothetical protein
MDYQNFRLHEKKQKFFPKLNKIYEIRKLTNFNDWLLKNVENLAGVFPNSYFGGD